MATREMAVTSRDGPADDRDGGEAHERPVTVTTDDEVFARIYSTIRRFAAVVGPVEVDPDDLVQEAVSRVLRRGSLSALDDPAAYLRRTIVNLAANERRRFGRWRRVQARVSPADGLEHAAYPSDVSDLLRLSPRSRAAVWLADIEGRPYEEVAELLGCSPGTARSLVARARQTLRTAITQEEQ